MRKPTSGPGFALPELLLIVVLLGLAGAASIVLVRTSALRHRRALTDGRQASVAVRALDLLSAGLAQPDTGTVRVVSGGQEFDVQLITGDSILAGAIEIRVVGSRAGPELALDVPRLSP